MHTEQYLKETAEIASKIDPLKIEEMVKELVSLRERGGRLFVIGLGGSAANASHAVNDFRRLAGIDASTPTDNVAELTASANDDGWLTVFNGFLQFSNCDDALFILSVGGGTPLVSIPLTRAIEDVAYERGMSVFGIVGRDGGYVKARGKCVILIPTVSPERVTPHTEGWQSVLLHCIVSHPDLQRKPTKW